MKAVAPIEGNAIGAVDAATSSSSSSDATAAATAEGPAAPSGLTQLPVPEGLELTLMSFVRRDPEKRHMLTVNNKPHILLGFDIPNALQMAVQSSQRHQLLYLLDRACQLGYNTIRVWAFSDGSPEVDSAVPEVAWQVDWAAHDRLQYDEQLDEAVLQPAPGVLNATLMRYGDFVMKFAQLLAAVCTLLFLHEMQMHRITSHACGMAIVFAKTNWLAQGLVGV